MAEPDSATTRPNGAGLLGDSLNKAYRGRKVVSEVSVRIAPGEVVGLLGPNGAGKTTSFYLILGLVPADGGRVLLDGRDITSFPMYLRAREGIGYLPQEASVFRRLSVVDNLLAVLELKGLDREAAATRAGTLLEEFGLAHVAGTPGYAMAPRYMLLDEPFAGIDPIAVGELQRIVTGLKTRGIGVLITDHNVRETLQIVDRAYIISQGRIFRHGTPSELADDADVRQVYLGERFRLD